jgi:hypothetical protein
MPVTDRRSRPARAEFGLDVTIGIVALANQYIVAVSDAMLSYDDIYPATDKGARKVMEVSGRWSVAFAGDPTAFKPMVIKIIRGLKDVDVQDQTAGLAQRVASEAFSETLLEEFAARHLYQLGYRSVEQFKQDGRAELGDTIFEDYIRKLNSFDVDVDFLMFGLVGRLPYLFEVQHPGRVVDGNVNGYAVVGSGYSMAMYSLRRKHLSRDLPTVVYRLLEAKFSSETASGVGRSTRLVIVNRQGEQTEMDEEEIELIRRAWEETLKQPDPPAAVEIIEKSSAVKFAMGGEP